jgi:hypothetical protein
MTAEHAVAAFTERRYSCPRLAPFRSNGTLFAGWISSGGVAERLIAPVLKTGRPKGLVSSNLTPSATHFLAYLRKQSPKAKPA